MSIVERMTEDVKQAQPDPDAVLRDAHAAVSRATLPELAGFVLAATNDSPPTDRRLVLGRLAAVALAALVSGARMGGEQR